MRQVATKEATEDVTISLMIVYRQHSAAVPHYYYRQHSAHIITINVGRNEL